MINQLQEYLKENKIQYSYIDGIFVIDGKDYILVEPNEEGLLFDSDFELISKTVSKANRIFKFGGLWYYSSNKKTELNPLRYLGRVESSFDPIPFLAIHGKYEILNGSRDYSDWCKKAKFLGVDTLGICEKNTLAGTLAFQLECEKNGIRSILGATYTINRNDYKYDIKCYVKSEIGWQNLLKINKYIKIDNYRYIDEKDFLELVEGLVIVVDPKSIDFDKVLTLQLHIDHLYYQLDTCEYVNNDRDKWYLENLRKFVKQSDIKPILITDAYYLDKQDYTIKKKLNLISSTIEYESNNQYFKSLDDYFEELLQLFNEEDPLFENILEKALVNLDLVAKECQFKIKTGEKYLPKYKMTQEESEQFETNEDLFWHLIGEGLEGKISEEKQEEYLQRIEKEFDVIQKGGVLDYFLILWDIIKWCEKNDILVGFGRGSAGGTMIGYLLNLHHLDPIEFDLLFERFLNEGRMGKLIEKEVLKIEFDDREVEVDLDRSVKIIREGNVKIISAYELQRGDQILNIQ